MTKSISPLRVLGWICAGVVAVAMALSVYLSAVRSVGLTEITVSALEGHVEPTDHNVPFVKRHEALPDYELQVVLVRGAALSLGAKLNQSAVDGLTWTLADPVSVSNIAAIRLQEQDKVVSDSITEVQLSEEGTLSQGYRFEFTMERSTKIGVEAFFDLPIGKAIAGAILIAVVLMILSAGLG